MAGLICQNKRFKKKALKKFRAFIHSISDLSELDIL